MLRFQHIEFLIGLAALPFLGALFFLLLRWKRRTAVQIGDPALVQQLIKNFSPLRFAIKFTLAFLAFTAVILGACNLQKPGAMENINRKGVDVMLVLDVSKSMLARDSKPNRLEKAKQLLTRLVDKLENDRLGLVVFAGRAYMQMPLTTDHGAAKMYIQDASPDIVPTQGTVIAEALKMANTSFNSKERKYKSIVLISDGEDHDPEALNIAKGLAGNGVMINTVGIGSAEGSPIVDPATNELKKDEKGETVISKLNEPELQQLADATNGRYIRLDNIDDVLITLTQQLDSIEKRSLNDSEFIDYKSYFQWFLGIALFLLMLEFFIPERKKERANRMTPTPLLSLQTAGRALLLMGLLVMGASLSSQAQKADALIRSGNRYYKKKQIDQSQKEYEEAVRQAPDDPAANYNLGNAQFRKNSFDEASKSYDASISHAPDNPSREKGFYNKGVAMIKQKKLLESIDSWKKALKLDASDQDARENLQKALMELKQQQQQQKDQKDKKDKKEDKKKEQDQQQKQQQQPKPQPSRLNKQQVEQLLKALQQKENEAQDKMNQNKVKSLSQPDKDW
ncbi:MAG TPA: VWA domain-containing protein [Puia sp.]|nr:VWA domain-containing protein [Puia sp.]